VKDTARASDAPNAGSEFLLGTVGHHLDPQDAGSSAAPFRGFSGDTTRTSAHGPVAVPSNDVLPAVRTMDLPDKPGYPHSFHTYQGGN
jgi:hypothetical protein